MSQTWCPTFALLFGTRSLEMVRAHLCYGNTNVKFMRAYAGLSDSFDGPTHHAIMDGANPRWLGIWRNFLSCKEHLNGKKFWHAWRTKK